MLVDGLLPFAGLAIYVSYSISIGDFLGLYFYCRVQCLLDIILFVSFFVNLLRGDVYCCRDYSVRIKFLDVLYVYFVIGLFEFALK